MATILRLARTLLTLIVLATLAFVPAAQAQKGKGRAGRTKRSKVVTPAKNAAVVGAPKVVTTLSGLTYAITRPGSGRQPNAGETVLVHYTGLLGNGVEFDSSLDKKEPIAFKLGAGRVIKGWDEGIAKLRVGDQATLIIPPHLGYGTKGAGGGLIPPGATLIFIVELLDVKTTSLSEIVSQQLETNGIAAAVARYHELKASTDIYTSEGDINALGYRLMYGKKIAEAIEVLKLNAEAYPKSANVYDSLAEAYMLNGERDRAVENYKKSLELDPENKNAVEMLKKLEADKEN